MRRDYRFDREEVREWVRSTTDPTTPDLAEAFNISVSMARWLAYEAGLEFFNGNHLRLKEAS